jgi:pimeloyl-ACP methyl ester carboxylesterase
VNPGLLACLLVCVLLAGCGGASRGTPKRTASLDGCVRSGGDTSIVHFPVGREERLPAALLGSGETGIVLANESDLDLCGWLPFARKLSTRFRVLLFDYGSSPPEREVAAAARELRREGAKAVVLGGASEGAKASILAAAADPKLARGLVLISPEATLRGEDVTPAARKLTVPALFVVSREDPYSAEDTPALERVAGSRPKRLVVVPGSDHGVYLLQGAHAAKVGAAIDGFLARLAQGA